MMDSTFYNSIAPFYDEIFPLKKPAHAFTQSLIAPKSNVLDAGCATGSMAKALADDCQTIRGFDIDPEMIALARQKGAGKSNLHFSIGDLLTIQHDYSPETFDLIYCYGNTLVHLLRTQDILDFLTQSYRLLKRNGQLSLQILNYEFILNEKIVELPVIDNETITFYRTYDYKTNSRILDFNTELRIKATGQRIKNSVPLNALKPDELGELVHQAGFSDVKMYSSFKQAPLTNNELPLILHARKDAWAYWETLAKVVVDAQFSKVQWSISVLFDGTLVEILTNRRYLVNLLRKLQHSVQGSTCFEIGDSRAQ